MGVVPSRYDMRTTLERAGTHFLPGSAVICPQDFLVKALAHENQGFVGEDIAREQGIFAHAILNKNEIETLSKTLPLSESFKECCSQDVR